MLLRGGARSEETENRKEGASVALVRLREWHLEAVGDTYAQQVT